MCIITHTLHPIPQSEWMRVTKVLKKDGKSANAAALEPTANSDDSTTDSISTISDEGGAHLSQKSINESIIIVDANRELRVKLYMGQVCMFCVFSTGHLCISI